ncbi:hypothetical protein ADEAN_001030800 [Angomonas deanei]|uniref:Uncharacterized protein n=1 Tax=Angomonas deanei TaxID=59799 RepID=A0A7G2CUM0_9TRYP|nr:hypothetical protein ADEAN_001030800 [Angomonas deanei]
MVPGKDIAFIEYDSPTTAEEALRWFSTARKLKNKKTAKQELETMNHPQQPSTEEEGGHNEDDNNNEKEEDEEDHTDAEEEGKSERDNPILTPNNNNNNNNDEKEMTPLLPYTDRPLESSSYHFPLLHCAVLTAYTAKHTDGRPLLTAEDWVADHSYPCYNHNGMKMMNKTVTEKKEKVTPPIPIDLLCTELDNTNINPNANEGTSTSTTVYPNNSTMTSNSVNSSIPHHHNNYPIAVPLPLPVDGRPSRPNNNNNNINEKERQSTSMDPFCLDGRLPIRTVFFKLKDRFRKAMNDDDDSERWRSAVDTLSSELPGNNINMNHNNNSNMESRQESMEQVPSSNPKEGTLLSPTECCVQRDFSQSAVGSRMIFMAAHHHHHHLFYKSIPNLPSRAFYASRHPSTVVQPALLPGTIHHNTNHNNNTPAPMEETPSSNTNNIPIKYLTDEESRKEFRFVSKVLCPSFFEERFPGVVCYRPYLHPPYFGGCFVKFERPEDAVRCLKWSLQQPEMTKLFTIQMARKDVENYVTC